MQDPERGSTCASDRLKGHPGWRSFPATATAAARPGAAAAPTMITADFQTFLRLLTTQMHEPGPVEPDGIDRIRSNWPQFRASNSRCARNDLLTAMQAGIATLGMGEMGGWIGMEARAEMPVNFDGQTVRLGRRGACAGRPDGADRARRAR